MEPLRPNVDAFLLEWLAQSPLKREWFFEQRDGTCRLMAGLASKLSETALKWRTEVAPLEWFAEAVCSTSSDSTLRGPRSRLTRQRWRESMKREPLQLSGPAVPEAQSVCRTCGVAISQRRKYCKACAVAVSTKAIIESAKAGRKVALAPEVMKRRRESGKKQDEALQAWNPADQPAWLTSEYYTSQIQPRLTQWTRPRIAEALSLSSIAYAGEIRNGKIVPHPRHWLKLAELVGVARDK
jgi:hypothetical protein